MFSDDFKNWWRSEKLNIVMTTGAGLLPVLVDWLLQLTDSSGHGGSGTFSFSIGDLSNSMIQSVFIAITLFILIRNRERTYDDLSGSKSYIKIYLERNCGIKRYTESTIEQSFQVVDGTIMQFYNGWIIVWILWLIYYLGSFVFALAGAMDESRVFRQVFNFLNSSAIFAIYLILTSVTVDIKRRAKSHSGILRGVLVWVFIFAVWLAGVCIEDTGAAVRGDDVLQTEISNMFPHAYFMVELLLSMFSTISFLLVVGKLNSNYLQIPPLMLLGLYLYALVQAYVPFCDEIEGYKPAICRLLTMIMPYVTLAGKVILMLTLMWISNQRRLVFFVIQKSISIDAAPVMLSDLNKKSVSF